MSDFDSDNPERNSNIAEQPIPHSPRSKHYAEVLNIMAHTEKANAHYNQTHEKWDQLRTKIRSLKLDHITTKTYKESSKKNQPDGVEAVGHHSFFMFQSERIFGQTPNRKSQNVLKLPKSGEERQKKIIKREDSGTHYQHSDIKRIYRSKTGTKNQIEPPIAEKQRPVTKQSQRKSAAALSNQSKTHYCLNAYKRQRNATENHPKRPPIRSQSNTPHLSSNNDLQNISLVQESDYSNRQIVRRKSNINGAMIEAIEASLLFVGKSKTLIMFTMDQSTQMGKFQSYRLILGPFQIKQLLEKFQLTKEEIATLAGLLVDYLELQKGNLKISKELLKSNTGTEQAKVVFETNPLVRLVTPRHQLKSRAYYRHHDHINKNGSENPKQILNSAQFDKLVLQEKKKKVAQKNDQQIEDSQRPPENIQMIHSKPISDNQLRQEEFQEQEHRNESIRESIPNNISQRIEEEHPNQSQISSCIPNNSEVVAEQLGTIKSEHAEGQQAKKD